jgi:hypothetical protein
MSANNPDITASDIITDVEARLGTPNISTSIYLPWISYAYQRTYQALANCGQEIKERLFGDDATITLVTDTSEYSIETNMPRFGGMIKVEVKYGATGDEYHQATLLRSLANWEDQSHISTTYRSKLEPLYNIFGDHLVIIPTPPSTDTGTSYAKCWYIKRPYQLDSGTDVIDIPYRFMYPIVNYVQAKAIQKANEDYSTSFQLEADFRNQLEEIAQACVSEDNENEGQAVEVSSNSRLYDKPF